MIFFTFKKAICDGSNGVNGAGFELSFRDLAFKDYDLPAKQPLANVDLKIKIYKISVC